MDFYFYGEHAQFMENMPTGGLSQLPLVEMSWGKISNKQAYKAYSRDKTLLPKLID